MFQIKNLPFLLERKKYEILVFALIIHLYSGVFFGNLSLYIVYIWPLSILFLGLASVDRKSVV